jgi:chromosome segregation ATPase
MFFSFLTFSQNYPRIEKDSLGNKFVVMTYEQAQKIDNTFELVSLLEKAGAECDSLSLSYVKVINSFEKQVFQLETQLTLHKGQLIDKDNQIENLAQRLKNSEEDSKLCNNQIEVKDKQITLLNGEISNLKTKRNIAYGVGLAGTILGVLIAILLN